MSENLFCDVRCAQCGASLTGNDACSSCGLSDDDVSPDLRIIDAPMEMGALGVSLMDYDGPQVVVVHSYMEGAETVCTGLWMAVHTVDTVDTVGMRMPYFCAKISQWTFFLVKHGLLDLRDVFEKAEEHRMFDMMSLLNTNALFGPFSDWFKESCAVPLRKGPSSISEHLCEKDCYLNDSILTKVARSIMKFRFGVPAPEAIAAALPVELPVKQPLSENVRVWFLRDQTPRDHQFSIRLPVSEEDFVRATISALKQGCYESKTVLVDRENNNSPDHVAHYILNHMCRNNHRAFRAGDIVEVDGKFLACFLNKHISFVEIVSLSS